MELIRPGHQHLASYLAALRRGWSPDTTHTGMDHEAIDRVTGDPDRYLALMDDREATGDPVRQPDGSTVPRLPGLTRWMWDDDFAGSINLRWQPGTTDLPPTCLGHIGYAVVPWKRGRPAIHQTPGQWRRPRAAVPDRPGPLRALTPPPAARSCDRAAIRALSRSRGHPAHPPGLALRAPSVSAPGPDR